ncbi:MAG: hypothetical protein FGM46_05000 [Ferruginibacter sp.]|nr:hypothetical protein [Ferruginibacter sp.]
MDSGKVMQSGTPEEIYQQPQNIFAAAFVGRYNLFTSKESLSLFNEKIPENAFMGILPEHLVIQKTTEKADASIKEILFTGTLTEYLIAKDERVYKSISLTKTSNHYSIGDDVQFSVLKENIKIITS